MRTAIKVLLGAFLITFASVLFLRLVGPAAMLVLTFSCALAIAGPHRWFAVGSIMLLVGLLVSAAMASLVFVGDGNVLAGVILFGLLPLAPAAVLWGATRLRNSTLPSPHESSEFVRAPGVT
jgi:hypothetical protein